MEGTPVPFVSNLLGFSQQQVIGDPGGNRGHR